MNNWNILFVGDIVIKEELPDSLISEDLAQVFKEHNLISCNFEAPVFTKSAKPIPKAFSPHVYMHPKAAEYVKSAGFNVISLANNHMYDYGQPALEKTLNEFSDQITVGAGRNFESAYSLKTTEIHGIKIGFLSFCESEFGALTEITMKRGGFAWINHYSVSKRIIQAKKQVDVLFVQAHTGLEKVDLPLPEWRQKYKEFIELGADAVIGHHPHIPQGWETYNEKPIFYSLGNFYFDIQNPHPMWNYSIALSLSFNGTQLENIRVIPVKNSGYKVKISKNQSFEKHLNYLCEILKPELYYELINQQSLALWENRYINLYQKSVRLFPNQGLFRPINWLLPKIVKRISRNRNFIDNLSLLHNIRIESHRWNAERALSILGEKDLSHY